MTMMRTSPARLFPAGTRMGRAGLLLLASVVALSFASSAQAQVAPSLGTADSFAVLGSSTVTNAGPTVVNGDLGVHPGSACTGFQSPCTGGGPGQVNGAIHLADGVALGARSDATTAYTNLAGQACNTNLTGQDLGTVGTLSAGVYCFSSSAGLTGALTLSGDADDVFIFQIGSTLTTAPSSTVSLTGGAQSCNVFWQIGTSASLDTNTTFRGNILANASIDVKTGATVDGRLLAGVGTGGAGAVTLLSNNVTRAGCAATSGPGGGTGPVAGPGGTGPGGAGTGAGTGTGNPAGTGTSRGPDRTGPRVRILAPPGIGLTRRPPASNVCTTRDFTARIRLADRAGIRRVKVYLDGKLLEGTTRTRFGVRIKVRGLRVGSHRITVVARDRAGNRSVTRRYFGRCALPLAAPRFTG